MSEVDSAWGGMIDKDLSKKAAESNLVETGRYRVVAETFTEQVQDKEFFDAEETRRNGFFGKPYGSLVLRLGSKRDGKGSKAPFVTLPIPKVFFLRVSPAVVMAPWDETKLTKESRNFGLIQKLAEKDGVTTDKGVMDWALEHPFELSISLYEGGENTERGIRWEAGNKVNAVYALKEGE